MVPHPPKRCSNRITRQIHHLSCEKYPFISFFNFQHSRWPLVFCYELTSLSRDIRCISFHSSFEFLVCFSSSLTFSPLLLLLLFETLIFLSLSAPDEGVSDGKYNTNRTPDFWTAWHLINEHSTRPKMGIKRLIYGFLTSRRANQTFWLRGLTRLHILRLSNKSSIILLLSPSQISIFTSTWFVELSMIRGGVMGFGAT